MSRFVFIFLLAATSQAMGGQGNMGDVSVSFPPPAGFCDLSESNPTDAGLLSITGGVVGKGGNKLLGMSADCEQLADLRASRRKLLDDFAQYQTSYRLLDQPPTETVQRSCAIIRKEGNKFVSEGTPGWKASVEAALKNYKMNQNTNLGVLAEEPRACYAGLVQQIHTQIGTDKTVFVLFAITAVKKRTVFVYRMGLYTGLDSVSNALAKLKENVAAFYAAN
jgi:hypothetical protein